MEFWQTVIITLLTAILAPLLLKIADGGIKAAATRFGEPRKTYRQLESENGMMRESFRQLSAGIADYEQFCRDEKNESAASTIASMKRDIKPEWVKD